MRRWLARFKPWLAVAYAPSGTLTYPCWTRHGATLMLPVLRLCMQTDDDVDLYVRRRQ